MTNDEDDVPLGSARHCDACLDAVSCVCLEMSHQRRCLGLLSRTRTRTHTAWHFTRAACAAAAAPPRRAVQQPARGAASCQGALEPRHGTTAPPRCYARCLPSCSARAQPGSPADAQAGGSTRHAAPGPLACCARCGKCASWPCRAAPPARHGTARPVCPARVRSGHPSRVAHVPAPSRMTSARPPEAARASPRRPQAATLLWDRSWPRPLPLPLPLPHKLAPAAPATLAPPPPSAGLAAAGQTPACSGAPPLIRNRRCWIPEGHRQVLPPHLLLAVLGAAWQALLPAASCSRLRLRLRLRVGLLPGPIPPRLSRGVAPSSALLHPLPIEHMPLGAFSGGAHTPRLMRTG